MSRKGVVFVVLALLLIVSGVQAYDQPAAGKARSVILLISDGMGPNHQYLAEM